MAQTDTPIIGRQGSYAKGVARRLEILDRAIEVFAERGADGASLRRIAQSIGVSHAALLHYFDSREQLLIAVYEHAEDKRIAKASGPSSHDAVEILVGAAATNKTVPGLVELYTTLLAASVKVGNHEGRAYFSDRFDRLREDLAERLRGRQQRGEIRDDVDANDIATLLIAASDGLQVQWLLEPSINLQSTLRTFATLLAAPDPAPSGTSSMVLPAQTGSTINSAH